jgi:hypothetical protein
MSGKVEKKRRRQIVRDIQAREHEIADAKRPIEKGVLRGLLIHLEETILVQLADGATGSRCDHTLSETRRYLEAHGGWREEFAEWLREYGGFCDCEVGYNVFDYWTDDRLKS